MHPYVDNRFAGTSHAGRVLLVWFRRANEGPESTGTNGRVGQSAGVGNVCLVVAVVCFGVYRAGGKVR